MTSKERKALREYLQSHAQNHDVAVTLTLKQQDGPTTLNEQEAEKNLRHFLNRFNKRAFGNAAYRNGKKVEVISIIERSYSGRLHHHLSLKNPFSDLPKCRSVIEECLSKTRWGYNQVDVRVDNDPNDWIGYITKSYSTDAWDPMNTHLVR